MSLFRTPPLQRRSCHVKRDRVRRRQLSCSVVVDEKKSFLLCVSRRPSRMRERVNWLTRKLSSQVCDGDIGPPWNSRNVGSRQFIIRTWHTQYLSASLSRVQNHMTKIRSRESQYRKTFWHVRQWFFRTQEFTNENNVPHLYFQDRTYERSIQHIIVPIVVRMIPRIRSLWHTNYCNDDLHKCMKTWRSSQSRSRDIRCSGTGMRWV